jgi:hypothetical protein
LRETVAKTLRPDVDRSPRTELDDLRGIPPGDRTRPHDGAFEPGSNPPLEWIAGTVRVPFTSRIRFRSFPF